MKLFRLVFMVLVLSLLIYTCNDNSISISNSNQNHLIDGNHPDAAFSYQFTISQDYAPSSLPGCKQPQGVYLTDGFSFVNSGITGCWEGNPISFTTNDYVFGSLYYCGTVNIIGTFTKMACNDEWAHGGGLRIKQNGTIVTYRTMYSVINCS
jgi:hypothetical protein